MTATWMATATWMDVPWMVAFDLKSLQNSLTRNWILWQPLLFVYWLPKHPVFWFNLTQSVRPPMVTYPSLCSTCVIYKTLCLAIGHQVLPTQPLPREAEDFPSGDNHSKHMPLLTYLGWLQIICYNSKFVFIDVNTAKVLLVVKTLIKNIEKQSN